MFFLLLLLSCIQGKNYHHLYSKYSGYVSCDTKENIVGSGGFIRYKNKNYFISAKHVIDSGECKQQYYCTYQGACRLINEFYYLDGNNITSDLVFIPTETKGVKLKFYKPKQFDKVHFSSHPWGEKDAWISEGTVAFIDDSFFGINSFAAPGSSGSVVFNKDKPIGIVIAIINTPYGLDTGRVIAIRFDENLIKSSLD